MGGNNRKMGEKKSNRRPVIGVTGPDKGGEAAWLFTALSILLSGGKPLRIRPKNAYGIEKVDGLVLGGGADINPKSYTEDLFIEQYLNKTIREKNISLFRRIGRMINWLYFPLVFILRKILGVKEHKPSDARDEMEFNLLDQAVKKGIPILGICRGAQLINIYFKGSLYEDINKFYFEEPNRHSIFPVKTIFLKRNSKLKNILELDELKVNALHNQAVKEKGDSIIISAKEENEVVQGIEHEKQDFIVGVQWHPEYLVNRKRQRRLFKTLIEQAR